MTTKYVYSAAAGTASGNDWTNAYTTFGAAVTANADLILVHKTHVEDVGSDITWTVTLNTRVICVDKDASDALAVMDGTTGYIGNSATSRSMTHAGAFALYFRGIYWRMAGASAKNFFLTGTDGTEAVHEACVFALNTSATSAVFCGGSGANNNALVRLNGCEIKIGATNQYAFIMGSGSLIATNCIVSGSNGRLLTYSTRAGYSFFEGCDLNGCANGLVADSNNAYNQVFLRQCDLPAAVTILLSQTSHTNNSGVDVYAYDCNSGDVHCSFYHGNAYGSTVENTSIYATAGAQSGGASVSYKVVTTANCSFYNPYVGPWIAKYNTTLSALTASFEILRDGSSTAYQDDEIWGEWQYKGTSGSVLLTLVRDRMTLMGAAGSPFANVADQTTGALGAGDWTGENATAWFGKLHTASPITPAEVGHIMGRVVVGEPNLTAYYDPQIRVA